MKRYVNNPTWLLRFAPFRGLSVSAAYLVPFFIEHGLSMAEIFLLQSIFSIAIVVLELPSGYLADRLGRARLIKLSVPLAAISMIAYGLSNDFWQFALCEVLLAVASGCISGADTALLYDSLKAQGREHEFERFSKRINSRMFLSYTLGLPLAIGLVSWFGTAATVVADGVLVGLGWFFARNLVEAPRRSEDVLEVKESALQALAGAARQANIRWLLVLAVSLSTGTYMGAWLSAQAYASVGIPVALFAGVLAIRSLWKAGWSHWYHPTTRQFQHMLGYAALVAIGFVAMASGQLWLLVFALSHDVVQALQGPALLQRLNGYVPNGDHRATLNSAVSLLQRLSYALVGPFVGFIADEGGLSAGLLAAGTLCSGAAFFALCRLRRLGTFRPR